MCQINFNLIARLCRKASRFKKFFIRLHFKNFWYFYLFPFSSFLFSHFRIFLLHWLTFYWVCLQFKNFREGNFQTGNFYRWVAKCSHRKFASGFSLKFRSIFVHISCSVEPNTVIGVWLEKSFPSVEFWSRRSRTKANVHYAGREFQEI